VEPINILVIDDDLDYIERLMEQLKSKDIEKKIGTIICDASMLDGKLEDYDPSIHRVKFDVVLIDYQLGCTYTGNLVSAWIMLQIKAPRMTLTSGNYSDPSGYFDGYICKAEVADKPEEIIDRIITCIETFNYNLWLDEQYQLLVMQYSDHIIKNRIQGIDSAELDNLNCINAILDKFERILDSSQEEQIKLRMQFIEKEQEFFEKDKKYISKLENGQRKLQDILSNLDKIHG